MRIARTVAQSKLLAGIKAELASREYFEEFRRAGRKMLAEDREERSRRHADRATRLTELNREVAHVIDAIASGLLSPALKARLERAEAERAQLMADGEDRMGRVSPLLPSLEATYRDLVDRPEDMPEHHIPRARAALQRLVGGIRLVPDGRHLTAEFTLKGAPLFDAAGTKISVVAGAGLGLRLAFPGPCA